MIMSVIQTLPFVRSFAQAGHRALALAVGFVTAMCTSALDQTSGETVYAVTYLDVAASSQSRGVELLK
jgi:hypothetical protein